MDQQRTESRSKLTSPRAAAVAGILFSVLLITSLVIIRSAIPADPRDEGAWLAGNWNTVVFALNLLPFAGIAFLWFVGVVRDRIGENEDRLFATVFLGSGLLFLAMLFAAAAIAGGILVAYHADPAGLLGSNAYDFAPRRHLRDPVHLRHQDGGAVHALDLHGLHPHPGVAPVGGLVWAMRWLHSSCSPSKDMNSC